MPSSLALRVPVDTYGRRPRSYDDLLRLAARCARDDLAGLTLVNHATQLSITLLPDALRAATRDGTPTALLRAIPALPSLLSEARYVRTTPDRRDEVSSRSVNLRDTRRTHLLASTAEIAGRAVKLLFTVRENFGGQCFLDRVTAPDAPDRRRQDGGGVDGTTTSADTDGDRGGPIPDAIEAADAADAPTATPSPPSNPAGDTVGQAYGLSKDILARYCDPQTRAPQSLAAIDTDRETYAGLQRQLADTQQSSSDPNYVLLASRASYYLYGAAICAGLADAADIPDPVIRGLMVPPSRAPFVPLR
jgi:hypothetical protein